MRIIKTTGMAAAIAVLAGCSWTKQQLHRHDNDYIHGSGQVHPMEVPGQRAQQMGEYYPVPPGGDVDAPPPSLTPPGSHLKSAAKQAPKKVAAVKKAQLVKRKSGQEALVLASNSSKSWGKIGQALKASGIQVLDQDSDMGTYFILDAKETNNKITKQTPILRVNLKPDNQQTEITLASHDNGQVKTAVADRILQQLQQHLG